MKQLPYYNTYNCIEVYFTGHKFVTTSIENEKFSLAMSEKVKLLLSAEGLTNKFPMGVNGHVLSKLKYVTKIGVDRSQKSMIKKFFENKKTELPENLQKISISNFISYFNNINEVLNRYYYLTAQQLVSEYLLTRTYSFINAIDISALFYKGFLNNLKEKIVISFRNNLINHFKHFILENELNIELIHFLVSCLGDQYIAFLNQYDYLNHKSEVFITTYLFKKINSKLSHKGCSYKEQIVIKDFLAKDFGLQPSLENTIYTDSTELLIKLVIPATSVEPQKTLYEQVLDNYILKLQQTVTTNLVSYEVVVFCRKEQTVVNPVIFNNVGIKEMCLDVFEGSTYFTDFVGAFERKNNSYRSDNIIISPCCKHEVVADIFAKVFDSDVSKCFLFSDIANNAPLVNSIILYNILKIISFRLNRKNYLCLGLNPQYKKYLIFDNDQKFEPIK